MHIPKTRLALCLSAAAAATIAVACIGPARAAIESVLSCDSTKPCLQWNNSGSGDSIKGISTSGVALEGQTKFKSAGKPAGKSGVLGLDVSTTGTLNSGVSGASTNGTGVTGTTTGTSGGNGVAGFSAGMSASGVYGQNSSTGFGVAGRSTSTTHNNGAAGVLADGGSANDALHATAVSSNAIYAFSQSGTPFFANQGATDSAPELYLRDPSSRNFIIQAVGPSGDIFDVTSLGDVKANASLTVNSPIFGSAFINSSGNLHPVLILVGGGSNTNSSVFEVNSEDGKQDMGVSDAGDVFIGGLLYSQGSCGAGCMNAGKHVRSVAEYAPVETEPTIEDNGEASLAGGSAYVALDPKFANVIDKSAAYLVSVTPEGDCRGLYVEQRSARGFAVRELQGGHANVGFEYRIVAKRYGVHAQRLPMTVISKALKPPHRN